MVQHLGKLAYLVIISHLWRATSSSPCIYREQPHHHLISRESNLVITHVYRGTASSSSRIYGRQPQHNLLSNKVSQQVDYQPRRCIRATCSIGFRWDWVMDIRTMLISTVYMLKMYQEGLPILTYTSMIRGWLYKVLLYINVQWYDHNQVMN